MVQNLLFFIISLFISSTCLSQNAEIIGSIEEPSGAPVIFANVALYDTSGSDLIKVEVSDDNGNFRFKEIPLGIYSLNVSYVGLGEIKKQIVVSNTGELSLGKLVMDSGSIELAETVITAQRVMVEVKPDRTVFNVNGTINAVGSDGLELLRKAPGVTIDNNDNISVLGRVGVLVYIDGKRLPLAGDDLSNYLKNLTAEQIDKIDIISSPGAKYEAEGNAGIIDIRLKRAENIGANGSLSSSYSRGRHGRGNINANGNYRNELLNLFGSGGYFKGKNYNEMDFFNLQNDLSLDETNRSTSAWNGYQVRGGVDFFLGKEHTLGILGSFRSMNEMGEGLNRIAIAQQSNSLVDSILVAGTESITDRNQYTINANYGFQNDNGTSLNIDLDYGNYERTRLISQPNQYFAPGETELLTEIINQFDTPSEIEISSIKIDYQRNGLGGVIGVGSKLSNVVSDNTFLFQDVINNSPVRNDQKSNIFLYDEKVYAGYVTYNRSLNDQLDLSLGLRVEQTDASGDLQTFDVNLSEPPVLLNFLNWFPNAGITWKVNPTNSLNLNYGRRINRPDYSVLNPFNFQLSEISFQKGNPFLRPEIVNNIELGYTLNYRYNFKLAYSKTTDQITRLIAPDSEDARANFITWANLAEQEVWGFSASLPIDISKKWNAYTNLRISHINNQADYGDGAIVDVQAFSYSIFQQHTITLPGGFKGEISGYFDGPGVWGGVFEYETSYSLNFGLQKKFLNDQLNVRLSVNDIFYQTGWSGTSVFDGLVSTGRGNWDSRRGAINISYNFGNQKVTSRKRNTGIDAEAGRVGS